MATFVEDAKLRLYYGASEGLQQRVEVVGVLNVDGSEGDGKGEIPASLFNLKSMTGIGTVYNNKDNIAAEFVIDDLRTSLHGVNLTTGALIDPVDANPEGYNITIIGIE